MFPTSFKNLESFQKKPKKQKISFSNQLINKFNEEIIKDANKSLNNDFMKKNESFENFYEEK